MPPARIAARSSPPSCSPRRWRPAPARACTISATGVAFGAYNPQAAATDDSTGTVNLACPTGVTAPVVALSTGQSGTYAARG